MAHTHILPNAANSGVSFYARRSWQMARRVWRGLREWCGDAAYERYLRSAAVKSRRCEILTPEEFYVDQLNRRYARPNRCC